MISNSVNSATPAINPFSLMMDPDSVLKTMKQSKELRNLHRRKLHPLDKPLIPFTAEAMIKRAEFDAAIDAQEILEEEQIYESPRA